MENHPFELNGFYLNKKSKELHHFKTKEDLMVLSKQHEEEMNLDIVFRPYLAYENKKYPSKTFNLYKYFKEGDLFTVKHLDSYETELWMFTIKNSSFGFRLVSHATILHDDLFFNFMIPFSSFVETLEKKGSEAVFLQNALMVSDMQDYISNLNVSKYLTLGTEGAQLLKKVNKNRFFYECILKNEEKHDVSKDCSFEGIKSFLYHFLQEDFNFYLYSTVHNSFLEEDMTMYFYSNSIVSLNEKAKEYIEKLKDNGLDFLEGLKEQSNFILYYGDDGLLKMKSSYENKVLNLKDVDFIYDIRNHFNIYEPLNTKEYELALLNLI